MIEAMKRNYFIKNISVILIVLLIQVPAHQAVAGSAEKNPQKNTKKNAKTNQFPFTPGDAVWVSTFPDTSSFLNKIYTIDDHGYIVLPIYGKLKVTDMGKKEFETFLKNEFKDYLRFPYLSAEPMIRVSVLGGVARPGLYYFNENHSIWDLLYLAGGTVDEDGLKQMRWERNGKVVKKNLLSYYQTGKSLKTIGFLSGDQIWVKTPGKPGFWDKALKLLPIVSIGVTVFALYITYQRTAVVTQ